MSKKIETFFISENYSVEDMDLWYEGEGWYFIDETMNYLGPFETRAECIAYAKRYVNNL